MRIPFFGRREKRESSFTDTLVRQIVSTATGGSLALPTATGALESCAGLVGRSFASAEIQGPAWAQRALTPSLLGLVGRQLIRAGEIVLVIDGDNDGLVLRPAADFDVTGEYNPETWVYRTNLAGPSALRTRTVSNEGVVHVRYAFDPARPWHGVGPIEAASLTGRLSAETLKALADEASGPRGNLLPVPADGNDPTIAELKADIRNLNGRTALVENQTAGWQAGTGGRVSDGWVARRLGADPPMALVELLQQARREIMASCGVPASLFDRSQDAAARESWRQFLHGTVAPLGRIVAAELSGKLDVAIALDWTELRASDLAGGLEHFSPWWAPAWTSHGRRRLPAW